MHMTETRYMEMQQLAASARRRSALHPTAAGAMLVVLPLLVVTGLGFLAFGDTREASWAVAAETGIAAPAATPADTGIGLPGQDAAGSSAGPTDYFPAGYVNRGADGDGNVMTYEYD